MCILFFQLSLLIHELADCVRWEYLLEDLLVGESIYHTHRNFLALAQTRLNIHLDHVNFGRREKLNSIPLNPLAQTLIFWRHQHILCDTYKANKVTPFVFAFVQRRSLFLFGNGLCIGRWRFGGRSWRSSSCFLMIVSDIANYHLFFSF